MKIQQKPWIGLLVASTSALLLGSGCKDLECDPRLNGGVSALAAAVTPEADPTESPLYWQEQWRKQVKEWWNVDLPAAPPVAARTKSALSDTDFGYGFERQWRIQKIRGMTGVQQIHFVVISEGFLPQDRKAFEERAASIANTFVQDETFQPYEKGITFWHAFAPSLERGISCDDNTTREKQSHFGSSYPIACLNAKFGTKYNDRFVMLTEFAKIQSFLRHLQTVTGGAKVVPLFLMQSDKYGGAAVPYAAMSTSSSDYTGVHELGHSFGGLMDEYVAEGDPCLMFQALGPNISIEMKNRTHVKWAQWIEAATPFPTPLQGTPAGTVGFFRGAANCKQALFKPSQECKMAGDAEPFCAVCKEQVILKLYETLKPARSQIRSEKLAGTRRTYRFQVDTLHPEVKTRWWVDGKLAFESKRGAPLELELTAGRHEIAVQAQDATPAVRRNRCQLAQTLKTSVDAF